MPRVAQKLLMHNQESPGNDYIEAILTRITLTCTLDIHEYEFQQIIK